MTLQRRDTPNSKAVPPRTNGEHTDNGRVRTNAVPPAVARGLVRVVALAAPVAVAACTADPVMPPAPPDEANLATEVASAREQLAALAAAGQDRHFAATYTLSTADHPDRMVTVTRAGDGTWRVDIPGGALGGAADVSVARTADGLYQCASTPSLGGPTCVRVTDPDGELPSAVDPRVQRPFTDWLTVLTNRQAPLSVSPADPPPGATGSCFAVESTSASLSAPLEVGVYCFGPDGTLTGARLGLGTLVLAGAAAAAPPTVTLPGPVVAGEPLGIMAPPAPTATPTEAIG
jgi:hypothetical protein